MSLMGNPLWTITYDFYKVHQYGNKLLVVIDFFQPILNF